MGRVKKSTTVFLFCLILILVFSSLSLAATGVVAKDSCVNPDSILFLMTDDNNAHAGDISNSYSHAVCYSNPAGFTTEQLLRPSASNARTCSFSNEIVSLSSLANAHVEGPSSNTYDFPICYNHLLCRVSSNSVLSPGEQVLAKLSGDTDAHITIVSDPLVEKFNKYLICHEPTCDEAINRDSVFPLISGFDTAADSLSATASGGAVAQISSTQALTGDNSLKLSYPIAATPADESVLLLMGSKNAWVGYEYLEFYLYVEKALGLSVTITARDGSITSVPIAGDVAPQGIIGGRWNLIQIPLTRITSFGDVVSISFDAKASTVNNFVASTTYNYYVDSIQLSSASANADFTKYYCLKKMQNGNPTFSWQRDLADIDTSWLTRVAPLTNITTSKKVCGEQPKETFADGVDGCFNSIFVTNGTPIDFLSLSDLGVSGTQLCAGSTCRTFLPPQLTSSAFTVAKLKPAGNNFKLESYDVKLNGNIQASSGASEGFENLLTYSLKNPRVYYGEKFTFDNAGVASKTAPGFYSCGDFPAQYDSSIIEKLNPATSACAIVGQYACSPSGFFVKQTSTLPTPAVVAKSFVQTELDGCCGANQCWFDGACRSDQSNNPGSASYGVTETSPGQRCYAGTWSEGVPKQNYDGSEVGSCRIESQCFATKTPSANKFACYNSTQFYQNYYCDDGNWTTRTAILASKLIEYADNKGWDKGTLYCDHYSVALNVIDNSKNVANIFDGIVGTNTNNRACSTATSQTTAQDIYNDYSCVNSFCVFSPAEDDTKPIFATSLNRPFSNISNLDSVFAPSCKGLNSEKFENCPGTPYFYDNFSQLVMYNQNFNPSTDTTFWAVSLSFLKTYFVNPIVNLISGEPSITSKFDLVANSKLFSRFYFSTNPSVSAFYEVRYDSSKPTQAGKPYYVFNIDKAQSVTSGLDWCADVVAPYNKKEQLTPALAVSCYTRIIDGINRTTIVGDQRAYGLWPKLTANLRPS